MKFHLTLYTFQNPRGETTEIEAASGTEAARLRDAELQRRACAIKVHAGHVKGWTSGDEKTRKGAILGQIAWLHGTVEAERV